ncbi:gas vesicle protein [Prauserella sp. PE36]|uniref:gas vesicle protein n=1 Tax=Prauserella sp. PE36 TaxID=1504709 RepID=UPI000D8A5B76|nr:gas vesicle protein [Prauserella sp. PE36]PXY23533.1 gas vesicle protein [Prauserella coralliicola]RBM18375.1 gas vesicle protein [Prauserella sp. PE36]
MTEIGQPASSALGSSQASGGHQPANLGDILERVLDKGLVIAGDIQVNLLDIELLTIKLRLVVASLETAKEVGINWWENDPWLTGSNGTRELERENQELRERIARLESGRDEPRQVEAASDEDEPVDVVNGELAEEEEPARDERR